MSGIVRGVTDRVSYGEGVGIVVHPQRFRDPTTMDVAVVPLDDATLAEMADRFLDVFESESKLYAMRAALGLGGEPTKNNQQGSHT